jgi:hypothetical protein
MASLHAETRVNRGRRAASVCLTTLKTTGSFVLGSFGALGSEKHGHARAVQTESIEPSICGAFLRLYCVKCNAFPFLSTALPGVGLCPAQKLKSVRKCSPPHTVLDFSSPRIGWVI